MNLGPQQGERKVAQCGGWHRQAKLGDGDLPLRRTIAKACGLDDATRRRMHYVSFRDSAIALGPTGLAGACFRGGQPEARSVSSETCVVSVKLLGIALWKVAD